MEYLKSSLIRQIDAAAVQELGIPGLLLMENAARGVCEVLQSQRPAGRVLIGCGPGNNGGDGLAVARLLAAEGLECEIHLVRAGKTLTADAASNLMFLNRCGMTVVETDADSLRVVVSQLTDQDWFVDALLGTGIRGTLQSPYFEIVEAVNRSACQVLSIDVPSGLDSETGEPCGVAVRANVTVTFVATKAGFRFEHATPYLGRVVVRHIGVPQKWLTAWCASKNQNSTQAHQRL